MYKTVQVGKFLVKKCLPNINGVGKALAKVVYFDFIVVVVAAGVGQ